MNPCTCPPCLFGIDPGIVSASASVAASLVASVAVVVVASPRIMICGN